MKISAHIENWKLRRPFRISGQVFHQCRVLIVMIEAEGVVGRGEAAGVGYRGETPEQLFRQVEDFAKSAPRELTRDRLQDMLPAGGARNAVDCALWELDAKRTGASVFELAGVGAPKPLITTFTIGADAPQDMACQAQEFVDAKILKLKLSGDVRVDIERLDGVRAARPDVEIAVDANRGYEPEGFQRLHPALVRNNVSQVEQPFAIGEEKSVARIDGPFDLIADESVQTVDDLQALAGLFNTVNIKLDKSGGLTHALKMARRARDLGLKVMVGNMVGTSWSQAAGFAVGQECDLVDLDGALFLKNDRTPGGVYRDGRVWFDENVWGRGSA